MVKSQAPGFYRLVGDFEITALSDGGNMLPATKLLQGDSAQSALKRNYLGDLISLHNSFLAYRSQAGLDRRQADSLKSNHRSSVKQSARVGIGRAIDGASSHTSAHGSRWGLMAESQSFPNALCVSAGHRLLAKQANMRFPAEAKHSLVASITPYMRAGKLAVFEGNTDLVPGARANRLWAHARTHHVRRREQGEDVVLSNDACMSPRCNSKPFCHNRYMGTHRSRTRA